MFPNSQFQETKMIILPATLEDIQDLETLVQSCYRGDASRVGWTHEADLVAGTRVTPAILKEYLQTPGVTILKGVDDSGKIIGCVYTRLENSKKLHVGMLCVRPDLQTQGLGKQLMRAVDDLATEMHCFQNEGYLKTHRTD